MTTRERAEIPFEEPRQIRRILACHDGDHASRYVVPWARALARATQAEVILVRILTSSEERVEATRGLQKWAASLERDGVRARASVAIGAAAPEIVRLVEQEDADIVVLGSHGRGPFGRVLLGSVADSVKDRVASNVLVARSPATPRLVLLATDDSPECLRALALGQRLAHAWNAKIVNIHAEPPSSAARGIVAEARGCGAGLVVVGSRGVGALSSIALGSVSTRVARDAPCSVLVVKE
ncbi:MAG: universal stress protein [Candidatus Thermoplasmatota archaeon]